jgi:hypothetical protein
MSPGRAIAGVALVATLAACLLVACSKSARPPPPAERVASASGGSDDAGVSRRPSDSPDAAGAVAAPTDTDVAAPARTPGLSLETGASPYDWRLHARGLPAVSSDGKRVAALLRDHDGMRGFPNGALVILDVATDKIETKALLLSADEHLKGNVELTPIQRAGLEANVRARIARAQALLAEVASWSELAAVEHVWDAGAQAFSLRPAAGASATLVDERLRVTDISSSRALLDRNVRAWRLPEIALGPGLTPCTFTPEIAELAVDRARRVTFVLVAQRVTRRVRRAGRPARLPPRPLRGASPDRQWTIFLYFTRVGRVSEPTRFLRSSSYAS